MKSFIEWGTEQENHQGELLGIVQQRFQAIDRMDNSIDKFLSSLTRDHEQVTYAYKKYKQALEALQHTIQTAIQKDRNNPDRQDHPPKTIQDDPRDA